MNDKRAEIYRLERSRDGESWSGVFASTSLAETRRQRAMCEDLLGKGDPPVVYRVVWIVETGTLPE